MGRKRSRFVMVGVLALALCVGFSAGTVDAKKKKKGAKGGSVTVTTTSATTLPPSVGAQPPGCSPFQIPGFPGCVTPGSTSRVLVPLTVGKKAKGKVVSDNSISITYTLTGNPRAGPTAPGSAGQVTLALTAPNGRTVPLITPGLGDANATSIGPVTLTPNSSGQACPADASTNVTVCFQNDPDQTVRPPNWTGTVGQASLAEFGGVPASGTWTVRARNGSTGANAVLSSVILEIGMVPKPKGK